MQNYGEHRIIVDDIGTTNRQAGAINIRVEGPKKLEVGIVSEYGQAKKVTGDGTIHRDHQPSKAALLARAEEIKGDALTSVERAQVINTGTSVNVPANVHRAGPTYGGKNTPAQINSDKSNLADAAARDADIMVTNTNKLASQHSAVLENAANTVKIKSNADYDNL